MMTQGANRHNDEEIFFDTSADDSKSLSGDVDLLHFVKVLRKHKWAIVLFTAAVTALAGYYAFTSTPVYRSTATLLIEAQGNNPIQFEELVGFDTENQDYYETQFELLRSRGLALRVIEHMDLWDHPELSSRAAAAAPEPESQGFLSKITSILQGTQPAVPTSLPGSDQLDGTITLDLSGESVGRNESTQSANAGQSSSLFSTENEFGAADIQQSVAAVLPAGEQLSSNNRQVLNRFMSRLTITPVRRTKLVRVSFESIDPAFAADVANTVGEQYIESHLDAKLELTTKASLWLNERLSELRRVLDDSEARLIDFKRENGLVDVGGSVGRLNEQELLLATTELVQAQSELASQSDLFREVQSLSGRPDLLESIPAIQADPLVRGVKIEQGQAQRKLDELLNRYGERHPRVVDATSQLATLNTTLEGHINRAVGAISNEYNLLQQRVASIESKLAQGKQDIQAIGTKVFELDELEREVATNREIYSTFFSRITEARSADGLDNANARISDTALAALSPFKPRKQLIIALAALASLVFSALLAIAYEQLDDTIKSTRDVERKLGVKLLGILPMVKNGIFQRARELPLNPVDLEDEKGTFAESVNTIRTAVCMDDEASSRKVLVVTSSLPGEGKSTTAINLAYTLSQLEKVLLIDCDMRRPSIAKVAGLDRGVAGLSSLITQSASAKQCINKGMFGGAVDVLPSGPAPDHPLELLSSKRFEKLLEQLGSHYDRIVIDSAPTQAVADALVLGRLSGGVVYCVKSHDTPVGLAKSGLQRLAQVKVPILGVVITQVDVNKIQSYGGDYDFQGYYDYYGYNTHGEKNLDNRIRLSQQELLEIQNDDRRYELDLPFDSDYQLNQNSENAPGMQKSGQNVRTREMRSQDRQYQRDTLHDMTVDLGDFRNSDL